MSDNIDLGLNVDPNSASGVERIVTAIDHLHTSLSSLGNNTGTTQLAESVKLMQATMVTGFTQLAESVKLMQATMVTGFTEMAAVATAGGNAITAAREVSQDKQLRSQLAFEAKQVVQANRYWDKQVEIDVAGENKRASALRAIMEKREVETAAANARERVSYETFWAQVIADQDKAAKTQIAIEQRRDVEMHALRTKASAEYIGSWEKMLAERQALIERRDTEMNAARARHDAEYTASWQKNLAERQAIIERRDMEMLNHTAATNARLIEMEQRRDVELHAMRTRAAADVAAAAEKQRLLNSSFSTSSISSQISAATRAQAYGALGGNASAQFGSAAATADIAALQRAHQRLQQEIAGSTNALRMNATAMNEAHSLARGLAGSLGGLWLTYGSVAPLLAGAAIAASLKNVVVVGKEVENQLNFVFALSEKNQGVNLDQFLAITDSSLRSVVESANAMRALAQNGLEASAALQVLPGILDLATVGEMNVAQAAIAATGATSAFGLSFAEAGRVADIFAKTAATSNTSVIAITESMKQASTVASLFKVTIEETAGVLGVLAKINVTGGAAGTSMTNMLTGLYEPTEKGKRALRELGLETMTASGAIKPFTQTMEELRSKLSGFNDSAKVDILGSIFTVRGVKAVQQVQENLGEFINKTKEAATATGYMRGVVQQLEDSTDGAFKRVGVTIQNSFVRAFAEAGPYVQQLGLHLGDMFKEGSSASNGISNFATNVARLTGAALDNAGVIASVVTGYTLWRVGAATLGPVLATVTTATTASTAAQVAASVATRAHMVAQAAGTATTALHIAMVEAQTVATTAATAATLAWQAALLPILGAVALAVAAGAALWLLFRDNTDDADKANVKISNSLHVVSEALDKEIERLEKTNKLWDERAGKYLNTGAVTPEQVDAARLQVWDIEEKITKASGGRANAVDQVRQEMKSNAMVTMPDGSVMMAAKSALTQQFGAALELAEKNTNGLTEAQKKYNETVLPQQTLEKARNLRASTNRDLEQVALRATEKDTKGNFYQPNPLLRAKDAEANVLISQLNNRELVLTNPTAEIARIEQIRTSLKVLNDERNAMQSDRAPKVNKKAENAGFSADLKELDTRLQLTRMQSQADIAIAQQQNKRGELGDLQLINTELKAKLDLDKAAVDVARQQYMLADAKDKVAKMAVYKGKEQQATLQGAIDTGAAQEKRASLFSQMEKESTEFESKQLEAKGQYVDAYNKSAAAKYSIALSNANNDLKAATDEGEKYKITRYIETLEAMKAAEADAAAAKQIKGEFGLAMDQVADRLTDIDRMSGPGAGLATMYGNAQAAAKSYADSLPGLIAMQKQMQDLANRTGKVEDKRAAGDMTAGIKTQIEKLRGVAVSFSEVLGKSLETAFGRGGKAVGNLLTSYLEMKNQQSRVDEAYETRKVEIQERQKNGGSELDAAKEEAENEKKRQEDQSSSQIKAYGDMAGAAAGFFSEQSRGYKLMMNVSKAFHMVELAQNTASMISGVAAGAAQMFAQGGFAGFAGVAAMAAVMGGLGFAIHNSGDSNGGGIPAAEVQKKQGTGTVFGDSSAKSNSIARGIELSAANSNIQLNYTAAMLAALNSIDAAMSGLANLVAGTNGLTDGTSFGVATGQLNIGKPTDIVSKVMTGVTNALLGPGLGGAVAGFINNLWGKTTQNIVDAGLQVGGSVNDLQSGKGVQQYASVDTTKSSWFGLSKKTTNSVQTAGVNGELSSQFGLIFTGLEEALKVAATGLGVGASQVTSALDNLQIAPTKISLKDLKGDELTAAINGVISATMDTMAEAALPGLNKFRKVGEGYSETVIRIATNYAKLDGILGGIGMSFGQVGLGSLDARESMIALAGGIDTLASQTSSFSTNFLSSAQQLAPVQKYVTEQMTALGLASINTRADFAQVVLALDLSRPEAQATYVALMALQDAFAKTHAATEDLTKTEQEIADERKSLQDQLDSLRMTDIELLAKERAALDASNRGLFDQIQAYKKVADARTELASAYDAEKSAIESTIERVKGLSATWKKFGADLIVGSDSPLNTQDKYSAAKNQFESTLAAAKSGDSAAQDNLTAAMSTFLEASKAAFASGDNYTADFDRVVKATQDAATWAMDEADIQKQSLDALTKTVSALTDIKAGVLTVAQAIVNLTNATLAARALDPGAAPTGPTLQELVASGQVTLIRSPDGLYYTTTTDSNAPTTTTTANNPATAAATNNATDSGLAAAMRSVAEQLEALRTEQATQNSDNIDATVASSQEAARVQAEATARAASAAAFNARNVGANA